MTSLPLLCQARHESDEMFCGLCALRWDVNDPEPPRCQPIGRANIPRNDRARYADQYMNEPWQHHADPTPRPSHYEAPRNPWRWRVLLDVRPPRRDADYYGPTRPDRLVLLLRVDGRDCGVLREFQNTGRERGECWEFVKSMNHRRG